MFPPVSPSTLKKPRGRHWGLDRERARQNPLLLGEKGERCPNAQRDWGESPRVFFSFFILQSHTCQAQGSLVTAEAATDIALGLHRNPKLSNKRTLFSDQVSDNPRKWEQIALAFLLSVFLLLGPRSNGSQRKYTAEQVIKTTAF